jgi:hypothetical protein
MRKELHLTFYTKPHCSLCDQLQDDLAALRQDDAFREIEILVREINIESDAGLQEKFQYLVPVLALPNQELHYPPHDYLALRNTLLAAAE